MEGTILLHVDCVSSRFCIIMPTLDVLLPKYHNECRAFTLLWCNIRNQDIFLGDMLDFTETKKYSIRTIFRYFT